MKRRIFTLSGILIGALTTLVSSPALALYEQARWFTLDNGMDVIVIENHRAPAVHARVVYKVGALDEAPGQFGIAHVLEHLMFRGSPAYHGRGLLPGQYDGELGRIGATDNASTSANVTSYYALMGSEHLELFIEMNAILMNGLTADSDQLENEKGVVLQEFRQRWENNPTARASHAMRAALRGASAYDHPIIGYEEDFLGLTSQDLLDFHADWYQPNNAALIVSGDVTPEDVLALARKHFGNFPAGDVPERIRPDAERAFEPGFETVTDALITKASARRAWRLPEVVAETGPEAFRSRYAARLLTSMLTSGLDAPFTRYLQTERQIALSAGFSIVLDEGQDWAMLNVDPVEGMDAVEVLDEAEDFLRNWLANDLTEDRLNRQKRRLMNGLVYAADSVDGPASSFASLVASQSDYGVYLTLEDTIAGVTLDDVREIAALFLEQASQPRTLALEPLEE